LREEKTLHVSNHNPQPGQFDQAETLEDAPLTAPLECSPFPKGAGRRPEGSGELPIGLRGSFLRSFYTSKKASTLSAKIRKMGERVGQKRDNDDLPI
jgi:hypothetical protein